MNIKLAKTIKFIFEWLSKLFVVLYIALIVAYVIGVLILQPLAFLATVGIVVVIFAVTIGVVQLYIAANKALDKEKDNV